MIIIIQLCSHLLRLIASFITLLILIINPLLYSGTFTIHYLSTMHFISAHSGSEDEIIPLQVFHSLL